MRNHAFLKVALLGLLTLALAPGYAAAAGQGQDLTEMLASTAAAHATAVSGPIASASPLNLPFGTVDIGSTGHLTLTVTNTGDQTLLISAINSSDPNFGVTGGGAASIAPSTSAPFDVFFSPTNGLAHSASLSIMSNASNGTVIVNATGQGNAPPILDPIGNKAAVAFTNLSFTVTGSDPNDSIDDPLAFSMSAGLPPGPTFNTNTGAFSWTPQSGDAGTYNVTFAISDGRLSDSEAIQISVTVNNSPPTANAGGSYAGGTGQPIQFNGSGSSDPDAGQILSYAWTFGDGGSSTEQNPVHTYGAPGNYIATLNVCDNGSPVLCDPDGDVASVSIVTQINVQLRLKNNGSTIRTHGGGKEKVGIEETLRPLTDIIISSVRMSCGAAGAGSPIAALTKGATIGDMDLNGVSDLDVYFSRTDINQLLGAIPNNTTVTITVTGLFQTATGQIPFSGSKSIVVKSSGNAVTASAYPNPFNPETSIAYTLKTGGSVTMRIYSLDGRLVRTLKEGEYAEAGTHEVRWNGVDNSGNHVPSAVYFVKTNVGAETSVFKVIVAK